MAAIWKGFLWKMDWISTSRFIPSHVDWHKHTVILCRGYKLRIPTAFTVSAGSRLTIPTPLIPNRSGRCFSFFKSSPLNFNPIDIVHRIGKRTSFFKVRVKLKCSSSATVLCADCIFCDVTPSSTCGTCFLDSAS